MTRAIDDYCERHDITRKSFSIRVGFCGDNAENQLSNHLNPRTMKNISHEREYMMIQELDDKGRELYFNMRAKEWGMSVGCDSVALVSIGMSMSELADDAIIESNEAFATIKKALKDGSLNKKEIKAIRKEAKEAVDFNQKMVDLAEMKLRRM